MRMRQTVVLIAVLAALGLAGLGVAPVRAESLNEALSAAYTYNPKLDAERATLRATDEGVAQAMSGWRPRINAAAEVNRTHINTRPDNQFATTEGDLNQRIFDISATQNLFDGWRTTFGIKSAEAGARVGREQLRFREQDVFREAVEAFMDTVRDEKIVKLREDNVNSLGKELAATEARFKVGEVTKTDVAQAKARRAQAVAALDVARANLKSARAKFERVIGHPPVGLVEPHGIDGLLPASLDEALAIGEKENPNAVVALHLEEQARVEVDRVRGELLPSVEVEARYTDTINPNFQLHEQERGVVAGRVNVPLYEGGEVYSRVRAAKHRHVSRLQQIEQARTEVREQITAAWSQLQASKQQIELTKSAFSRARPRSMVFGKKSVSASGRCWTCLMRNLSWSMPRFNWRPTSAIWSSMVTACCRRLAVWKWRISGPRRRSMT